MFTAGAAPRRQTVVVRLVLMTALVVLPTVYSVWGATYTGWRARLPVAILYGERKCTECEAAWRTLESAEDENWGKVRISFVNVRWHKKSALRQGVTSTPMVIYRTNRRTEVARQQGAITLEEVNSAIARLIAIDYAEKHPSKAQG